MNIEKVIEIQQKLLLKKYAKSRHAILHLEKYTLQEGIIVDIILKVMNNYVELKVYPTENENYDTIINDCECMNCNNSKDLFHSLNCIENISETNELFREKINKLIRLIYDFKIKYCYSKILDEIVLKTEIIEKEEECETELFLKHENFEECSVCYERNTVLTKCKHNLCRFCFHKIKRKDGDKECPICKRHLLQIYEPCCAEDT